MTYKVPTKEFLIEQHHKNGRTVNAISKEVGCSNHTIRSWLKRYEIEQLSPVFKNRGMKNSSRWSGIGEVPKTYYTNMIKNANTRGYSVEVSHEFISKLFDTQGARCAISGQEIGFGSKKSNTASLDRIDSDMGYIPENVWWIHKDVNMAKRSMSTEDFVRLCSLVANHQLGRL